MIHVFVDLRICAGKVIEGNSMRRSITKVEALNLCNSFIKSTCHLGFAALCIFFILLYTYWHVGWFPSYDKT